MKNLTLFIALFIIITSCNSISNSDDLNKDLKNVITVDDEEFTLAEFITINEVNEASNGYYVETWIYPNSIIFDYLNCDFSGEGYGVSLFFVSSNPKYIDSGIYDVTFDLNCLRPPYICNEQKENEVWVELDFISKTYGWEEDLISGSLEIVMKNDLYSIKLDAITEKSKKVTVTYTGELKVVSEC